MRKIFSTSRTAVISTACIAVIALMIAAAISINSNSAKASADTTSADQANKSASDPKDDYIGVDRAKEIALEHADMKKDDVRFLKAERDTEDGRTVYEISFYSGKTEYEYTIDAVSGDIIGSDVDRD